MLDYYLIRLKEFVREDFTSAQKAGALLIFIVILAGAVFSFKNNIVKPAKHELVVDNKPSTGAGADKKAPKLLYIHVAGEVKKPGLYKLDEGKRVADAITEAGDSLESANIDAINLAEPLIDGMKIVVPSKAEVRTGDLPQQNIQGDKVNINTASLQELESLPGVGPATAQRIVDYREKSGRFKSVDELKMVNGIGEKKFEDLKEKISLY